MGVQPWSRGLISFQFNTFVIVEAKKCLNNVGKNETKT